MWIQQIALKKYIYLNCATLKCACTFGITDLVRFKQKNPQPCRVVPVLVIFTKHEFL